MSEGLQMGEHVLPGNPPIPVSLRRSTRARRLSLRVSRIDGRVTLTLPRRAPLRDGIAFLREREGWIRGHLADRSPGLRPAFGARLPLLGREVELVPGRVRAPRLDGARLILPEDEARLPARLGAFLKAQARAQLAEASDRHAASLGRSYGRLTLRDTRSRWGSCSSEGNLMYSWRLVMAPWEVLDYVAAHEVAHLAEMNHSPAFWAHVARLCPDHQRHRRWLRENGEELHRLRLTD